jgi:hypothetical protein
VLLGHVATVTREVVSIFVRRFSEVGGIAALSTA